MFKFKLIKQHEIGVVSCSAIEESNNGFIAFGDNVPFMYYLSQNLNELEKKELSMDYTLVNGVMPKQQKFDIESTCFIDFEGKKELIAFPSGSTNSRYKGFRILEDSVMSVDFKVLFQAIQTSSSIAQEQFNLEGAAYNGKYVVLANRGTNHLILIPITDFNRYLTDGLIDVSCIHSVQIELNEVAACFLGLSGLAYDPKSNEFYFTASQEATQEWYSDGEVLGSAIGRFKLRKGKVTSLSYSFVENDQKQPMKIKLESLVLVSHRDYNLIAVSDSDGGKSEAFYFKLTE